METLRSPKQLTGPALGLPALTFRAWFEAQFGLEAWDALDKIPRLQWMDYLRWYRRVLGLDVRNEHRVLAVLPRADGLVRLDIESPPAATRCWRAAWCWPPAATAWAAPMCPASRTRSRARAGRTRPT